jgi:activator of 2-hydroxyglutaryl-CoA dehydratase
LLFIVGNSGRIDKIWINSHDGLMLFLTKKYLQPREKKMEKKNSKKYSVGIDAGSVSLNCIVIDECREIVFESAYKRHFGKIDEELVGLVEELFEKFGENRIRTISFTGSHGKKLAERLRVFYEFETISQVLGTLHLVPDAKSLICMGGQDTALLQIHHEENRWELESFNANGPCASGTGSFIDQQAERLATALYEKNKETSQSHIDRILNDFIRLGLKSENPANVACRCTVFTKSDMIHLQNKGEKLEDIIYGLHVGNARNYDCLQPEARRSDRICGRAVQK